MDMGTRVAPEARKRDQSLDTARADGALVTLERVTVWRGTAEVLREVSLDLARGGVTAVVGRSGVGKSTLVGVLNGLIVPRSGRISVAGLGDLGHPGTWREHRRRTATVFQDHALIERLSAVDNVLLGLADRRHPLSPLPWSDTMRRRAAEALDAVDLLDLAGRRVGQLSGGERQRVGIARALVRRPTLLLGDEPFASVDPSLAAHLGRQFRQAVALYGATVLLVLHQIETAMALADRVVGLAEGRVVFDGPVADFGTQAREAVFGATRPSLVSGDTP